MSEVIMINGNTYEFKSNYCGEETIRESFNHLIEETYGFNFRNWYEGGYWKDRYIPYSLLDGVKVVANVSINVMDFLFLGEKKCYVQIGTIMTEQEYRHQGLSRVLPERVLTEWQSKCDLIYLFVNDEVLDFYPKFVFRPIVEY